MLAKSVGKSINLPVLAGGAALMLAGYALYRFFSPSPHGFLEIFFAMPVFCLGLAFAGVAFLTEPAPRLRTVMRCFGVSLIILAASPILYLAWIVVR